MSSKQFYRRELPDTCISFYSPEGKSIFREALATDNMECYFKLAAQFRTQDEPAFCGLTSLVVALNALDVDPGKVWKGPWRWYHERMLNCCKPLEDIQQDGITFDVFVCLASCNYLDVLPIRPGEGQNQSLEHFRETVIRTTKLDNAFIIASYSRKSLQQTGEGHFSPIGGYHPGKDLVLILDTARFKYPPHWVPLETLYEAMTAIDKTTGLPRGYAVMSRRTDARDLLLFRLSDDMNVLRYSNFTPGIKSFIDSWETWLTDTNALDVFEDEMMSRIVDQLVSLANNVKSENSILSKQEDIKCPEDIQRQLGCSVADLLEQIASTEIYTYVKSRQVNPTLFGAAITFDITCDSCRTITLTAHHFFTVFALSWPYSKYTKPDTNARAVNIYVQKILSAECNKCLRLELSAIENQFTNILQIRNLGCC